eukprot:COSAG01_NODE_472_length_16538_cov_126.145690_12_plen_118_part_00
MRLLTETPTHHPKNPVNSENFNHPTQGKVCNPGHKPIWKCVEPCVDGSDNRLGKFLFQIIEATRGGMPTRDGNRSPRDDGSWGSRAKDFVICAEAALHGKKGVPYPLNNSSLGRWVG